MGLFIKFLLFCCCATFCSASEREMKQLLDEGARKFSSYSGIKRQHFVDEFSKLVLEDIKPTATKSVNLQDEYAILKYGYQMKLFGTINMFNGVTSKINFKFGNAKVVNFTENSNILVINTLVNFDSMRLSYANCKLAMMGTNVNGTLSARINHFQGEFNTLIDFEQRLFSLVHENEFKTNARFINVVLNLKDVNKETEASMFEILANQVVLPMLENPFRDQLVHVFQEAIISNIKQLYK